jgi:subfamily B ATP-binding cassette protein HlyB/CyaB
VPEVDPAAGALAFALQILGLPADATEIRHAAGRAALDEADLLRAARRFPVRVRAVTSSAGRLPATPLPALARLADGSWVVLGRVTEDRVLLHEAAVGRTRLMPLADFLAAWSGRLVLLARRGRLTDPHRRFGLGWFIAAARKYRGPFSEVLVASFFLQLFALVTPLFFQVVIDKVLVHRGLSTLEVLALGLGLLALFDAALGGLRTYLFTHTTNRVDVELAARLFRHLTALPLAYFQARRVGDTVARVRELETVRQFITSSALTLVLDLAFAVAFLAVLFLYSVPLAAVVAASLPLYVLLSLAVLPALRARLDEKFRSSAENQAFLVETVGGIETVKAMALEPALQRRWEEQVARTVAAAFRASGLANGATQGVTLISRLVTVLILYLGARQVIAEAMTVGELVAFNMLASQLAAPVLRLAGLWQEFQQARLSIDRLGDVLNAVPEPGGEGRAGPPPIRGEIRLDEVTFRYRPDGAPVVDRLSLQVPAGQVLGIVGPSGSGKSTLAKLLQRLYVQESGRILVDGIDLSLVDPAWLRRQVGVVLQESVLFNRSVRENIAIADPAMPIDRVVAAAELAGAHGFIGELPEGYDTLIGERGATLSGGQRQRIAIARALVGNPRILIFDEATSALDYESEAAIQANMQRICAGRTVILIAHRLSTLRIADRIVTLERGRLVEDGTPEALLRAGGRFAQLWRLQSEAPGGSLPAPATRSRR